MPFVQISQSELLMFVGSTCVKKLISEVISFSAKCSFFRGKLIKILLVDKFVVKTPAVSSTKKQVPTFHQSDSSQLSKKSCSMGNFWFVTNNNKE